ncbi:MAG: Lrp/AsnC family transcriptional regulator [Methanomassiliicoccales archaeon]|nr:MAG: Lrp/AsnC family transcriptional regulator [Methanomassiliicoccales archaeon]
MVNVDPMNKRILRLLAADGKMTYNDIAKKLRRSPSTVRDRIRRLEDDKVILGYFAVVNNERMGIKADAIVLAKLKEGKGVEDLRKMKQVTGVKELLQVSGPRRVLIRVNAVDNRALEETVFQHLVPMGLCDVELRIVLESVQGQASF